MRLPLFLRLTGALLLLTVFTGCSDWPYYQQSIAGHLDLMRHRQPIQDILADPETPEGIKQQLRQVQDIRHFASWKLGLPDNGSYTSYVDLHRPYVVWNVVATTEFSLTPKQWCYPVAGCLPYRGFYRQSEARAYARTLRRSGHDVTLYGVPAYSTLRYFDDPVLSTFSHSPLAQLAALVFHELAHQQLYLPNDARFNEAFAVAVEIEGVRRFLQHQNHPGQFDRFMTRKTRSEQFVQLLLQTRARLQKLYDRSLPYRQKRVEKHLVLRRLRQDYADFKQRWGGFRGYDGWFDAGVNNARLASVSTYHELVDAFRTLFRQEGENFPAFYRAASHLAGQPPVERHYVLYRLSQKDAPHWQQLGPDIPPLELVAELPPKASDPETAPLKD